MLNSIFDRIVKLVMGIALVLIAIALGDFLLHPLGTDYNFHSSVYRAVTILVLLPLTLLMGFLIIRRVPGNIVGPLLIVWSGTVAYNSIRDDISLYLFAAFYYFDLVFGWLAFFLTFLHFPDGRIFPKRVSVWLYPQIGINLLLNSLIFLSTARFEIPSQLANPFFVPALERQANLFLALGLLGLSPILILGLVSAMGRYRKGKLLERQQIKWLALYGAIFVLITILGLIIIPLLTGGVLMVPGNNLFAAFLYLSAGLLPPLAIGMAVLRYRLWDIDIIIRRTLVYSILTVILGLVYSGCVVSLQALSLLLTQQRGSQFATILSTLALVTLFTPLRGRIQERIDRRFYRRKYDAEKVMAGLSNTLREEVDLGQLRSAILEVVEGAMQPEHVSMWLRSGVVKPKHLS